MTTPREEHLRDRELLISYNVFRWQEEAFPKLTLGGQLAKLEEEMREHLSASVQQDPDEMIKELADIFIVLTWLDKKHNSLIAANIYEDYFSKGITESVLDAVEKKLEVNKGRTWEYLGDGKYHHVKVKPDFVTNSKGETKDVR